MRTNKRFAGIAVLLAAAIDDLIGSFPVEGWGTVHLTNDGADYTLDVQR